MKTTLSLAAVFIATSLPSLAADFVVVDDVSGDIRILDDSTGTTTLVPTGGVPPTPSYVTVEDLDTIVVVDPIDVSVRRVTLSTGSSVDATPVSTFARPRGVVRRATGNIVVLDAGDAALSGDEPPVLIGTEGKIVEVDSSGNETVLYSGVGQNRFLLTALALEPNDEIIFSNPVTRFGAPHTDVLPAQINRLNPNGSVTTLVTLPNSPPATTSSDFPIGLAVDSTGEIIVNILEVDTIEVLGEFVSFPVGYRIERYSSTGTFLAQEWSGGLFSAPFNPISLSIDSNDDIIFADQGFSSDAGATDADVYRLTPGTGTPVKISTSGVMVEAVHAVPLVAPPMVPIGGFATTVAVSAGLLALSARRFKR